jgi:hypothetical protein
MAQAVRILRNWFDAGELVFKAGEVYPADEAALRQVELGNGEAVEADQPAAPVAQATQGEEPAAEAAPARRKKQA